MAIVSPFHGCRNNPRRMTAAFGPERPGCLPRGAGTRRFASIHDALCRPRQVGDKERCAQQNLPAWHLNSATTGELGVWIVRIIVNLRALDPDVCWRSTWARWRPEATLSHRYITDRFLPDKAIDLIDEAAARCNDRLHPVPRRMREGEPCGASVRYDLADRPAAERQVGPAMRAHHSRVREG